MAGASGPPVSSGVSVSPVRQADAGTIKNKSAPNRAAHRRDKRANNLI